MFSPPLSSGHPSPIFLLSSSISYAQKQRLSSFPAYSGKNLATDHAPAWKIECVFQGETFTGDTDTLKKAAEQRAAYKACCKFDLLNH